MRVTTAFSRLLRLGKEVVVKKVRFEPDRVIVEVPLRLRLICPEYGYSTPFRSLGRVRSSPGTSSAWLAWLATRTDKTTITQVLRIDSGTVGRIIKRVCDDELDPGSEPC